jgi:hypothetical protein
LDGDPVLSANYRPEVQYGVDAVPVERLRMVASRVKIWSFMIMVDAASATSGRWMIVERGGGRVAGLPTHDLAVELYAGLASARTEAP